MYRTRAIITRGSKFQNFLTNCKGKFKRCIGLRLCNVAYLRRKVEGNSEFCQTLKFYCLIIQKLSVFLFRSAKSNTVLLLTSPYPIVFLSLEGKIPQKRFSWYVLQEKCQNANNLFSKFKWVI